MRNLLSFSVVALCAFAATAQNSITTQTAKQTAQVPFVGCKSDGQVGQLPAPKGHTKTIAISPATAEHLAYYQTKYGLSVLAPRGWYCFGIYGSSGSSLFVSPTPLKSAMVFSDKWKGFDGPAIQLSDSDGGTSGRFEVAEIAARVFPAHKAFVRRVIAEGIEPATDFPFGPYPKDKLTYKGQNIVEYETPAQTEGLGTRSYVKRNADPIRGLEIFLDGEPSLMSLAVRLPPNMIELTSTIIQEAERRIGETPPRK